MEDHCDMTWDVIVNAMGFNGYGIWLEILYNGLKHKAIMWG
jgi:hypothetical protein